jgi:hypothetical protein
VREGLLDGARTATATDVTAARFIGVVSIAIGVIILLFRDRYLSYAQKDVRGTSGTAAAQRRNNRVLTWVVPIGFILVGLFRVMTGR